MSHDAIVIGAGANSLVTAHLLARAGRSVLVLEQHAEPDATPDIGWVPPGVVAALAPLQGGLAVRRPDPWVAAALPDGGTLELRQDMSASVEAIRRLSPADAAKWPAFCERMRRLGSVLEELYAQPAPDVETVELAELLRLGKLGLRVRRLGRQAVIDLLRVLPMSAAELLDDWFQNDALKAVLGASAVMHLCQGPRSGGTAFVMLHHHAGSPAGVFRPPVSNLRQVLERSAQVSGVTIRRGARVERIVITGGRATGVVLAGGEEIAAKVVVSGADPRATLLGLTDAGWLDPEFLRAVRNIKCRGVAAQVTLRLDRLAPFARLLVAPSLDYLERAYDGAKHGNVSDRPWLEAHADEQRVHVHVQYVPYKLKGAEWDEGRRAALGTAVTKLLAEHAPGLAGAVTGCDVMTPHDLEARDGLTEGHAYHGELTLDQILFMRPVAGWSRNRTPIRGLYLCGAGAHPGGAIAGGAGAIAAGTILQDTAR